MHPMHQELTYLGHTVYVVGRRHGQATTPFTGMFYDLSRKPDSAKPDFRDVPEANVRLPEPVVHVAQSGWAMPVEFKRKLEVVK